MIDLNAQKDEGWGVTSDRRDASNPRMVSVVLDRTRPDPLDEDTIQIERFLSGDVQAFNLLYSRYYDKVFAIARGVLLDADEAADTVQEVFTLVHRHLHRFDRRARFSTWLFRIAINRSIQDSRKKRRRPLTVELQEVAQRTIESDESGDPKIEAALAKLKPDDRALLLLYYWEQLSLTDIAETISSNVNATKTRLYRAREKFRAAYEGEK